MKNGKLLAVFVWSLLAVYACSTTSKAPNPSKLDYNDLYKVWQVDTILVLNTEEVSTPNIEMDKNEYKFTRDGKSLMEGNRTTITPEATVVVPFTIKKGYLYFDPDATFPILDIDKDGNLKSSNLYGVSLPPYQIMELNSTRLSLKNKDIMMKLKAK